MAAAVAMKNFRLLFCHGLGNAKSDLIARRVERWALDNGVQLNSMTYRNYGDQSRIWDINDWRRDIAQELRGSQQETVVVSNSAAAQAVLRALLDVHTPPAGLLMISPGVGIQLEDYMERILPGSVARLRKGEVLDHPAADKTRIRVDMECLQEFVNNCVTRQLGKKEQMASLSCPVVRIVHGLYDKLVPYGNSLKLLELLKSANKGLFLINDGHFVKDQQTIGYALDSLWGCLAPQMK